jgi:tetratricopeptide (TPR) repeat protein
LLAQTTQALALGLLASARPGDAVTLLAPLLEAGQPPPSAQLLSIFGRALRENGQPQQALSVMGRAEELAAAQGDAPLRQALRQDQGETLIALGRPFDALRLIEGNDDTARRQRAFAFLSAVRAYYQPTQPGRARSANRRGPFPPLRQGHEQPETRAGKAATYPPLRGPIDLSEVQTARGPFPPLRAGSETGAARGPFPPLRAGSDAPEGSAAAASPLPPQGLNDERQVLSYAQAALRAGSALSASERAEAMLYQVVALARGGQFDLALRRLTEVGNQFDLPTLDSLLGPGGFAHLKARLTLRGGDFYQGASLAQQALQQIQPTAARALQSAMAVAYTSKAIDLLDRGERGDVERANSLVRSAQSYALATSPENQARMQYNLAVLQLYRGRAEEARALLSRIDPQVLPTVWLGLGSYYDQIGDSRTALDHYRRYLGATEPGDPQLALVRQWVDVLERIYEGSR